jgi:uncharacterized membrane protein
MNEAGKRAARFALAQAAFSFAGAIVAGAIWWAHRRNIDLPCTSGGGCELVMSSAWSQIHLLGLTIPLAFLGFLAYLTLLVLSLLKWASETDRAIGLLQRAILSISAAGFLFSWYLQWVAHYRIGAFCIWCRTSACIMTLLFCISAVECLGLRRARKKPESREIPHAATNK